MKHGKTDVALFLICSVLIMFAGCSHRPDSPTPADTRAGPDGTVRGALPTPPDMAWVPAGSFRSDQRTPSDVTAIVIHTTEGRYDDRLGFAENQARNFRGTIEYFRNNDRNVSAHYVLGPGGEVCQMVSNRDVAYTQTYYNGRSIGIECAGWGGRAETWTPELMEALVNLTAYLCVKWDIPAYHPSGTAYEGPHRIVLSDGSERFDGSGLVGHFQIQPWNKTDPGPHFPWEEFSERVRERIAEFQRRG